MQGTRATCALPALIMGVAEVSAPSGLEARCGPVVSLSGLRVLLGLFWGSENSWMAI